MSDNVELLILSNLISDKDYATQVVPHLKREYFQEPANKIVYDHATDFIEKYKNLPTMQALVIQIEDQKGINEQDHQACLNRLLELKAIKGTDKAWLVGRTEKFCRERAIFNALMTSISIVEGNDKTRDQGSIPQLLQDALAVSFDNKMGHDYLNDVKERLDEYHRVDHHIPTRLEIMNRVTQGGFAFKTLNVFMMGTGVGKTLTKCSMAADNLMMGKNVVYFTNEISESEISKRIDANLLDVDINEILNIPDDVYIRKFADFRKKFPGNLIIKEYPTGTAGAAHFRYFMNELQMKKGFSPEVVYVDYINNCVSSRFKPGQVNSYGYVKAVAEELRGLAVERNLCMVSSTQLNREGLKSSDPDITNTSESMGLPMTVDWMGVGTQSANLAKAGQVMIRQVKSRYDDLNKLPYFIIGMDKPKMRLHDVDPKVQAKIIQDIQAPSVVQSPEDALRSLLNQHEKPF